MEFTAAAILDPPVQIAWSELEERELTDDVELSEVLNYLADEWEKETPFVDDVREELPYRHINGQAAICARLYDWSNEELAEALRHLAQY